MSGHICAIPRLEDTTCGCRQLQTVQSCLTQEVFCPLTGTDGPLRSGKWPRTNVPYLHTILDVQGVIPQGSQAYSFHGHGFQVWFWQYFAVVTPCRPMAATRCIRRATWFWPKLQVGKCPKWEVGKCQKHFVGKCPRKVVKLENVRIFFAGKWPKKNSLLESVIEKSRSWKMS